MQEVVYEEVEEDENEEEDSEANGTVENRNVVVSSVQLYIQYIGFSSF